MDKWREIDRLRERGRERQFSEVKGTCMAIRCDEAPACGEQNPFIVSGFTRGGAGWRSNLSLSERNATQYPTNSIRNISFVSIFLGGGEGRFRLFCLNRSEIFFLLKVSEVLISWTKDEGARGMNSAFHLNKSSIDSFGQSRVRDALPRLHCCGCIRSDSLCGIPVASASLLEARRWKG